MADVANDSLSWAGAQEVERNDRPSLCSYCREVEADPGYDRCTLCRTERDTEDDVEVVTLACPYCGSTRLRSDETATIGYPVTLVRNASTGSVEPEYTGDEYIVFDEGTEYSADIWCRDCGANPDEDELVVAETE
jgi:Zn finger protein HypA/HybF involved in hydrogenase expression